MNVSISAPVFDLGGHAWITGVPIGGITNFERRNNRVATLDGGAVIPDFGYSDADRTFDIRWPARDQEVVDTVRRLAKTYSRLIVSTAEGCFIGAPGPFSLSDSEARLQILIEARLDQ